MKARTGIHGGHLSRERNYRKSQRMLEVLNAEKDRRDRDRHAAHNDQHPTRPFAIPAHRNSGQNPRRRRTTFP